MSGRFDPVAPRWSEPVPPDARIDAGPRGRRGAWALLRRFGARAVYFRPLVRAIHEPFAEVWPRRDLPRWLEPAGFRVEEHHTDVTVGSRTWERVGEDRR